MRAVVAVALGFASALVVLFVVRWLDDGMEHVTTFRLRNYPTAIAWSPDGRVLVSISEFGGSLSLWDVKTGRRTELGGVAGPYIEPSLLFMADGRHLLAPPRSDESGKFARHAFTLWDVATATVLKDIEGPAPQRGFRFNNPHRYEVSQDGKLAALVPIESENMYFYDIENWSIVKSENILMSRQPFWTFALSQDASKAILARTSLVSILDIASGQVENHRIYKDQSIRQTLKALSLSPDGKFLAIAGYPGVRLRADNPVPEFAPSDLLQVRSLADWSLTASVPHSRPRSGGTAVSWSADGAYIAVANWDSAIVYATRSATVRTIKIGTVVTSLAFSPVGNLLAVGEGGAIRIYKVGPGKG